MRCAQALAIVEIKWTTTITKLHDVVGIHALLGLCLTAPMPTVVHCLTPTTSTGYYPGTPYLELTGIVGWVNLSWR
jgi:hypothetical protein